MFICGSMKLETFQRLSKWLLHYFVNEVLVGTWYIKLVPDNLSTRWSIHSKWSHNIKLIVTKLMVSFFSVLWLHSNGMLAQWTDKWYARSLCPASSGSVVISLLHVQGVLLVLPLGIAVALASLAAEIIFHRWQARTWADKKIFIIVILLSDG